MNAYRPGNSEYYYPGERSELFSQGDIFRDVPLAYPTALEERDGDSHPDEWTGDWLSAGRRRFLSGPLEFGTAMLITPSCAMSAQGAPGYAHPIRTLIAIRSLKEVVEHHYLNEPQAADLVRRDRFHNYMYLPADEQIGLPESVALLYYPITVHHNFLDGNRIKQLALPGAQQLQHKLVAFYSNINVELHEFDPPMD